MLKRTKYVTNLWLDCREIWMQGKRNIFSTFLKSNITLKIFFIKWNAHSSYLVHFHISWRHFLKFWLRKSNLTILHFTWWLFNFIESHKVQILSGLWICRWRICFLFSLEYHCIECSLFLPVVLVIRFV